MMRILKNNFEDENIEKFLKYQILEELKKLIKEIADSRIQEIAEIIMLKNTNLFSF